MIPRDDTSFGSLLNKNTKPLGAMGRIQAKLKDFLEERAGGTQPEMVTGFVKDRRQGLLIRYGQGEYFLSPLNIQEPKATEPNGTLTVEGLMALNLSPPEPIVEGFLHKGETCVFAGRQKVGKSRNMQQMALCVSNGEPFLGMPVPNPMVVLMIDMENRAQSLSHRFRQMGGRGEGDGRLLVWCARSLAEPMPDSTQEGCALLKGIVENAKPDVLIIDPWRIWLGGDENDPVNIVRGLKVLAQLRDRLPDLAIVIVHHVRKEKFDSPRRLLADPSLWMDAISGHHALMSHVDSCFGLERQMDDNENPLIVFGGIARNTEPRTLILGEDDTLRFHVAAIESSALQVMTKVQKQIWEICKIQKRFRFIDLLEKAATTNRKAVSKTLGIAVDHGLLVKDDGMYKVTGVV